MWCMVDEPREFTPLAAHRTSTKMPTTIPMKIPAAETLYDALPSCNADTLSASFGEVDLSTNYGITITYTIDYLLLIKYKSIKHIFACIVKSLLCNIKTHMCNIKPK